MRVRKELGSGGDSLTGDAKNKYSRHKITEMLNTIPKLIVWKTAMKWNSLMRWNDGTGILDGSTAMW